MFQVSVVGNVPGSPLGPYWLDGRILPERVGGSGSMPDWVGCSCGPVGVRKLDERGGLLGGCGFREPLGGLEGCDHCGSEPEPTPCEGLAERTTEGGATIAETGGGSRRPGISRPDSKDAVALALPAIIGFSFTSLYPTNRCSCCTTCSRRSAPSVVCWLSCATCCATSMTACMAPFIRSYVAACWRLCTLMSWVERVM